MSKLHKYSSLIEWTGNLGEGTQNYTGYSRDHMLRIEGKPDMLMSSDPAFRGDPSRYNPEELLLASLSSCHMLWYLHFCADNNIRVLEYKDQATGEMEQVGSGGKFISVTLRPRVVITDPAQIVKANSLHQQAHQACFIANSVNFPVQHEPECFVK